MVNKPLPESAESALEEALELLLWVAQSPDIMGGFLGTTGADPAELREAADRPDLLLAVVEYVLQDDRTVLDAASALGWAPERFVAIRNALPGGAQMNWT
jgi:hypothetical protein